MDGIYTQVIDMDTAITEHVVKNKDDTYTIFLNARLSWERILLGYHHAVNHITNGDFEKEYGNVNKIEFIAHNA